MKRMRGMVLLLAAAGGCVSTDGGGGGGGGGGYMSQAFNTRPEGVGHSGRSPGTAGNLVGPYGQPVAMTAPASTATPLTGEAMAQAVLAQSLPQDVLQQINFKGNVGGPDMLHASGNCPPGGCLPNMLPSGGMMPQGAMGQGGMPMMLPGGIAPPGMNPLAMGPIPGVPAGIPGAVAAVGALTGGGAAPFGAQRTEVRFVGPKDMKVSWFAPKADGKPGFGANFLDVPGRYNFLQAAIYRLKLSDIPGYPGIDLYPTLEVVPANAKTATFLAHSAVPVSITDEDLEQVKSGNYVVKVIYLPDPQFQDLASTGPDEVVSSRLDPGVDPIAEAQRKGCILLVVRLGNIDLEAPNTPAMDAPPPGGAAYAPGTMPGAGAAAAAAAAGRMVPYGALGGRGPMMPGQMRPQMPAMLPPVMPPASGAPTAPIANPALPPLPAPTGR